MCGVSEVCRLSKIVQGIVGRVRVGFSPGSFVRYIVGPSAHVLVFLLVSLILRHIWQ